MSNYNNMRFTGFPVNNGMNKISKQQNKNKINQKKIQRNQSSYYLKFFIDHQSEIIKIFCN